jgi:gas vesicle protein
MTMERESQWGTVAATGFILGLTVGAVATLMFAPQTGRTTRHMLIDKVGTIRNKFRGNGDIYEYEPEAALSNATKADYLH